MNHPKEHKDSESIRKARAALAADPRFHEAFHKLFHADFREHGFRFAEWLVSYYNYQSYKRHLQRLKRRRPLGSLAEAQHRHRFQQLVQLTRTCVSAAEAIGQLLSESGVEDLTHKYKDAFFILFPDLDSTKFVRRAFVNCGASDDEIGHYAAWLRSRNWSLLDLPGSDGTFRGVVRLAPAALREAEQELSVLEQNGLPAIEGASGSTWVAVLFVLSGGISELCYIEVTDSLQWGAAVCFDGTVATVQESDTPQGGAGY